jgi:hypothetical protein
MSPRVNDFLDAMISESVNTASPREGFAAELLMALREMPVLPVGHDPAEPTFQLRWIVPGAVAGTLGAAGVVWFGIARRHRRGND